MNYKSKKFILIIGPCSIHNYDEFIDYVKLFKNIKEKYSDKIFFVIRAYSEKSRSTGLWKGYLNDPDMDSSCDIEKGIVNTRKIFNEISKNNIAIATEILCPITCYYLHDFVSWSAIGARTCETQTNRIIASDFNYPIGFKNDRKGDKKIPMEGINYSSNSHNFLSINNDGNAVIKKSEGNKNNHIILRGALDRVNYKENDIKETEELLKKYKIGTRIIIDCSHDNAMRTKYGGESYKNQKLVVDDVLKQIKNGNKSICGLMLESNINEGQQKMESELKYGVSITDSCIGINETEYLVKKIYDNL